MEPLIITQVKELLAKGDLEDAVKLLGTYAESNLSSGQANKVRNEIIHLQGQISEVKKAELQGLIAFEQAERNRNQIRVSMLSLTDALTGKSDEHPIFSAAPPAVGAAAAGAGGNNVYKYIVVAIGAIALFVVGISMCDTGATDAGQATEFHETDTGSAAGAAAADPAGADETSGCYLTTLEDIQLLEEADHAALEAGMVPADVALEVLETKIQTDAELGEIEFLKVRYKNIEGWVWNDEANVRLSPGCN